MTITFTSKDGWVYHGGLYTITDDYRKIHLTTVKDIVHGGPYYKVLFHRTKTSDNKNVTDEIYVSHKLKFVSHRNGDMTVTANRIFCEVGMLFVV